MSPILQNPLSNPTHRIKFHFPNKTHFINPTKTPIFPLFPKPLFQFNQKTLNLSPNRYHFYIKSSISNFQDHQTSNKDFNFDGFLSVLESICLISSVVVSVGCVVNWVFFRQQNLGFYAIGNRVLVFLLAGAVVAGSVIRRRQWRRVCGFLPLGSKVGNGNGNVNVIERVEMLEESMKSVTTIIRVLSRQLEKLGVRFRLHRKALKDPISEAAALAQKNSEATRALALQEDILEKELGEVQKVLLAMQDQQHKQLELILAIAKSGKLIDTKQEAPSQGRAPNEKAAINKQIRQVDGQQIQAISGQQVATNDVALGS